ncbi:right-handed parallel beta-helix repeat-containing protein [Halorientalis pallida]|uniref:Right handed beta helix region n=1 Tax=Halorientalis pallida TaxID=2479928 RepID=A0A498KZQ6_9EURY|nr:hypothetical protein [Halorientalis pallida]RXK51549.1 hypothetical protein EAF64_02665 [Halorientalis pallida]
MTRNRDDPRTIDASNRTRETADDRTRRVNRRRVLGSLGATAVAVGLSGCQIDGDLFGSTESAPTADAPTDSATPNCGSFTTLSQSDLDGGATLEKGCYRIDGILEVTDGTLTLEAGVYVEFGQDAGIHVESDAGFETTGTTSDPVILTGQTRTRGFWRGVRLNNGPTGQNDLRNTILEYAGGGKWHGAYAIRSGGLLVSSGTASLDGVTLRYNERAGLRAPYEDPDLTVANTRIASNELSAQVHSDLVGGIAADNTVENNDTDRITITGGGGQNTVGTSQTWVDPGVEYYAEKDVRLAADLTVEENVTVQCAEKVGIEADGVTFETNGSGGDGVVFTGSRDSPGAWQGIFAGKGATLDFVHTRVEYAGGEMWTGADDSRGGVLIRGGNVTATFDHCIVTGNGTAGIKVDSGGTDLTVTECIFSDNAAALQLHANVVDGLDESQTFGSDSYVGVQSGPQTRLTDAATWHGFDAPYRLSRNLPVDAPLTVEPGATIEAHQDVTIFTGSGTDGSINADGSGSSRITFTGVDGTPGTWNGISFITGSADNVLRNVVVENAGQNRMRGGEHSQACVLLYSFGHTGTATIENSTIRDSGYHGISYGPNSNLTCGGNQFSGNAKQDVKFTGNGVGKDCT